MTSSPQNPDASNTDSELSGPEKAAILLITIGSDAASELLKQLNEEEVRLISSKVCQVETISSDLLETVLEEAHQHLDEFHAFDGGRNYARKVLTKTVGERKAKDILKEIATVSPTFVRRGTLHTVQTLDATRLLALLSGEHPQVIAMVLAHLDTERAAIVLTKLPEGVQCEVLLRLATLDSVSPEIIDALDEVFRRKIQVAGISNRKTLGGISPTVDLLNMLETSIQEEILAKLNATRADLATEIKESLFTFSDLALIPDRDLQILISEIPKETLVLAMKKAPLEVAGLIFENMSERQQAIIQEDVEDLGPVRVRDVEKAQAEIAKIARELSEGGRIVIRKRGESDDFV